MKATPLLLTPPTVTTTFPVVAPVGTGTVIDVLDQAVGVPVATLNFTVLLPWVPPKPVPVMMMEAPTWPDELERPEIFGATDRLALLLLIPFTVTTTLLPPPVALLGIGAAIEVGAQLEGLAEMPPSVTVFPDAEFPNPVPVMVIDVPAIPEVGDSPEMLGVTV